MRRSIAPAIATLVVAAGSGAAIALIGQTLSAETDRADLE